jgi:carbamoyl-phosphate synthase large subunit
MALSSRFAGRTTSLLRQIKAPASTARAFTTRSSTRCLYAKTQAHSGKNARYVRLFSSSTVYRDETQTAPNAKAYLESGVIKGAANPVNVKKVLVIGSGGLSIGQAGEFDYSGWSPEHFPPEMSHEEGCSIAHNMRHAIKIN